MRAMTSDDPDLLKSFPGLRELAQNEHLNLEVIAW